MQHFLRKHLIIITCQSLSLVYITLEGPN